MVDLIKLNKEGTDEQILHEALKLKKAIITAKRGTSESYYHFIDNGEFYSFCYDTFKECYCDNHNTLRLWFTEEEVIQANYHSFKIVSFEETKEPVAPEMGLCRVWLNTED